MTVSESFQRGIHVVCLYGRLLKNFFLLWTVIILLLWLTHFRKIEGKVKWSIGMKWVKKSLLNRVPRVPKCPNALQVTECLGVWLLKFTCVASFWVPECLKCSSVKVFKCPSASSVPLLECLEFPSALCVPFEWPTVLWVPFKFPSSVQH